MGIQTVLLTSFEPFGTSIMNSSERLLAFARKEDLTEYFKISIEHRVLPVSWKKSLGELNRTLARLRPNIVIAFGESSDKHFKIETRAHNHQIGRIADNDGNYPEDLKETAMLPHFLTTQINAQTISAALLETGVENEISNDAGSFLCNFVYYHLLQQEMAQEFTSIFIHVPVNWELSFANSQRLSDAATEIIKTVLKQVIPVEGMQL